MMMSTVSGKDGQVLWQGCYTTEFRTPGCLAGVTVISVGSSSVSVEWGLPPEAACTYAPCTEVRCSLFVCPDKYDPVETSTKALGVPVTFTDAPATDKRATLDLTDIEIPAGAMLVVGGWAVSEKGCRAKKMARSNTFSLLSPTTIAEGTLEEKKCDDV